MCDLAIVDLADVGYERWFEVGPRPADIPGAIARLQARRARPGQSPYWLVALDRDAVVRGRVAGYVLEGQQLTLWTPRVVDDRSEEAGSVVGALVKACWERGVAQGVRVVECRPGHDSPHLPLVTRALREAGLTEVACAHEYAREGASTAREVPASGVTVRPCSETTPGTLEDLVSRTQAVTGDRAQATNRLDADVVVRELARTAGPRSASSLWYIALVEGTPVGYVLGSRAEDAGHVLEIGVVPEARRRGIAQRLLGVVTSGMERSGAGRITAVIDDVNVPSLTLFRSAGFVAQPGEYWTWRRDVR